MEDFLKRWWSEQEDCARTSRQSVVSEKEGLDAVEEAAITYRKVFGNALDIAKACFGDGIDGGRGVEQFILWAKEKKERECTV